MLARDTGAAILIVHVEDPTSHGSEAYVPLDLEEELQEQLGRFKPADHVIGTHGRTGLARLAMGSVCESVVRRAPCPVLSVKQPIPQQGEGDARSEPEA